MKKQSVFLKDSKQQLTSFLSLPATLTFRDLNKDRTTVRLHDNCLMSKHETTFPILY